MAEQEQHIQNLLSLGSGKTEKEIRDLLEKHNWNPDAAAGALFDVSAPANDPGWGANDNTESGWSGVWDNASQGDWSIPNAGEPSRGRSMERGNSNTVGALNLVGADTTPRPKKGSPGKNEVIDLTRDDGDDGMAKALQLSLQEAQLSSTTTFKPSDRAPDANWAMVPSNVPIGPQLPSDDQDIEMSRAVEASLKDAYQEDVFEELLPVDRVRKGGRPIALRSKQVAECWGSILLHALYYIPQIRTQLASMTFPGVDDPFLLSSKERHFFVMQQFFTLMTYGQMAYFPLEIGVFEFQHASGSGPSIEDLTDGLYENMAFDLEQSLFPVQIQTNKPWPRLFHFRVKDTTMGSLVTAALDRAVDRPLVRVDYDPTDPLCNDLITCLTSEYLKADGTGKPSHTIELTSDVIAFNLRRKPSWGSGNSPQGPFSYPSHFYLDRFMSERREISEKVFQTQTNINESIRKLEAEKKILSMFEGKDVLPSLRTTLFYLEEVSESRNDPLLVERNRSASEKLKVTIGKLEARLQEIEKELAQLREEVRSVFDTPELQKHQYDLRAVLFRDGLYGRQHTYSYVRDYRTNTWWRTIDYEILEMTEDAVLNDPAGLHLGGGPYLLLYSRKIDEAFLPPEVWPERIRGEIREENINFRSQLPDDLATALEECESPDLLSVPMEDEAIKVEVPLAPSVSHMSLDDD